VALTNHLVYSFISYPIGFALLFSWLVTISLLTIGFRSVCPLNLLSFQCHPFTDFTRYRLFSCLPSFLFLCFFVCPNMWPCIASLCSLRFVHNISQGHLTFYITVVRSCELLGCYVLPGNEPAAFQAMWVTTFPPPHVQLMKYLLICCCLLTCHIYII